MVKTLSLDAELHRQVHPRLVMIDGEVMSGAFTPSRNDDDKLSTRQGALMSPRAASHYHVSILGLASAGTWTFTVADADPAVVLDDSVDDDAHASVCFDHCPTRGAREKLAKQIKSRARNSYTPEADVSPA